MLITLNALAMDVEVKQVQADIQNMQESLQEAEKYTYTPRELLVLLDETEKDGIYTVGSNLLIALAQKAAPILVSASLVKNVLSDYGKNIPKEPEYKRLFQKSAGKVGKERSEALVKIITNVSQFLYDQGYDKEKTAYKYILLQAAHFDPKEWVIKRVHDFLYLFIPVTYLNAKNIDVDGVRKDTAHITTVAELQLGLHVNHMQTIGIEHILEQSVQETSDTSYFMKAVYNDQARKSDIFCLRSEYRGKEVPLPAWTILMMGHGYTGGITVSLEKEDFKKLLNFLQNKIICRLLVYNTCFSAGLNLDIIYKDVESMTHTTYSFPIVMNALSDAAASAMEPHVKVDKNGDLLLDSGDRSLTTFFAAAAQPEIVHYRDLLRHIFGSVVDPNDTPQIKMPGLPWFSVLGRDQVVGIGDILATSRDAHTPLAIKTFFKSNPRILLLYAADVPFEIQLNSDIESIVSMVPGDAIHSIEAISSTTKKAEDIVALFMKIEMLGVNKLFFIKEIEGFDKTIHNVIVLYTKLGNDPSEDTYSCKAYFMVDQTPFIKPSLDARARSLVQKHTVKRKDIRNYQQLLQLATNQPQHIQEAYFVPASEWHNSNTIEFAGVFPLSSHAVIEKIEDEDETVSHIFSAIQHTQPSHAITLVKEIRGMYDQASLSVHHDVNTVIYKGRSIPLEDETPITVTNVIVDADKDTVFFTHAGNFYQGKKRLHEDYLPSYMKLLIPKVPLKQREGSLLPIALEKDHIEKIKGAIVQKRYISK